MWHISSCDGLLFLYFPVNDFTGSSEFFFDCYFFCLCKNRNLNKIKKLKLNRIVKVCVLGNLNLCSISMVRSMIVFAVGVVRDVYEVILVVVTKAVAVTVFLLSNNGFTRISTWTG